MVTCELKLKVKHMEQQPPEDWRDDPLAVDGVMKAALEQYERMKGNPYAAIGLANVIAALNKQEDKMIPIVTAVPTLRQRLVAWWYRVTG